MRCLAKKPRPSYFNIRLWDQVLSRCRLLFALEEDWDIRDFLIEEGLSPQTVKGIISWDQVTLTPQEASNLADLLLFPEDLLQALMARMPKEELLALVKELDGCEDYDRKPIYGLFWDRTPHEDEALMACLRISWGLGSLDAASPHEDILSLAYDALCWTIVGNPIALIGGGS
jgi:hypothetical protein